MFYLWGHITYGDYFTFNGVKYGYGTQVLFTKEFYKMFGEEKITAVWLQSAEWPLYRTFHRIEYVNGEKVWGFGREMVYTNHKYKNVDIEKYIVKIVKPVYFIPRNELVKKRLKNGTWINFIWKQTLKYAACVLISPIFKQGYLIWTTGLLAYLWVCYYELSRSYLYECEPNEEVI